MPAIMVSATPDLMSLQASSRLVASTASIGSSGWRSRELDSFFATCSP